MILTADETIDMGRAGYLKALWKFYQNQRIIESAKRKHRKEIFPLRRKRRRIYG